MLACDFDKPLSRLEVVFLIQPVIFKTRLAIHFGLFAGAFVAGDNRADFVEVG